jgi:hypothetical protein
VKREVPASSVNVISSGAATGLPVEIVKILESYKHVFDEPSKANIDPIKFWPKDDAVIRIPKRSFAEVEEEAIDQAVDDQLKTGAIRESKSP